MAGGAALLASAGGDGPVWEAVSSAASHVISFMGDGPLPKAAMAAIGTCLYMLGTLLPDVDSKSSALGRFCNLPVRHRTWFHSLWPVALIALAGWFARPLMWLALGYAVHLFWDSLSRMGVCWLYPHPGFISYEGGARVKRNHWLWTYHTGTVMESVTCYSSVAVAAVVAVACISSGALGALL